VPLDLPRREVAEALGFAGVQRNVTAVQASRGKLEVVALAALWALGATLGKFSWDVILFSSQEFGFLGIPARFATGSSIMPHKSNPDLFELTRAREGVLAGCLAQALALSGKLPSGYHRDLQMLKAPVMTALDTALAMARMIARVTPALEVDRARCRAALDDGVFATDAAYAKVRAGVPFRRAYREVAAAVKRGEGMPRVSEAALLASRREAGGAGNPGFGELSREIRGARRAVAARRRAFDGALARLAAGSSR
jgi:argininosuccinate lyase